MKYTIKRTTFLTSVLLMLVLLVSGSAFAVDEEENNSCEKLGHTYEYMLEAATTEQAGKLYSLCINCLTIEEGSEKSIAKIDAVKLSNAECIYNGKSRKPTVKVEDTEGVVLVEGTDYDVVYPEEMKLPGKYEILVSFKGNYAGDKVLSFVIVPKATTGVKVKTTTTNAITLMWTKTTGATGYRIYQYSSSKGKYVVKDSVKDVTTYKVTGLKDDTTYKFKIKPYYKSEDGTVIWGSASSVCSAKTKVSYGVKMSASSVNVYIGATKSLKATANPVDKTIVWKSDDTSIAKVSSSGVVTAVNKGTTAITAYFKLDGKTYKDTCKVTVKSPSVKLNKTSVSLGKGDSVKIKATTAPSDLAVTWKSSNTSVATVSSSGKVIAKNVGSATITASIIYKGVTYKKTCKITVRKATAKENVATLISYINTKGKFNNYGEKCIKKKVIDDDYIYNYEMIINSVTGGVSFYLVTDCPYGEGIESEMQLHLEKDISNAALQSILISYNSYGETLYTAWANNDIKPSSYVDETSAFNEWFYNRFPNKNTATEFRDIVFGKAMAEWDKMVKDAIGVGMVDLGFINYKG